MLFGFKDVANVIVDGREIHKIWGPLILVHWYLPTVMFTSVKELEAFSWRSIALHEYLRNDCCTYQINYIKLAESCRFTSYGNTRN